MTFFFNNVIQQSYDCIGNHQRSTFSSGQYKIPKRYLHIHKGTNALVKALIVSAKNDQMLDFGGKAVSQLLIKAIPLRCHHNDKGILTAHRFQTVNDWLAGKHHPLSAAARCIVHMIVAV